MPIDRDRKRTWAAREIAATPKEIFAVLRDPSLHPVIDGSGTVKGVKGPQQQLSLGSRFRMRMRLGIPYVIAIEVVEFEEDRLIAWRHLGRHRWRYELEPTDAGTLVTETFDWSTALSPRVIELAGFPTRHEGAIERTLERLDAFMTHRSHAL